MIVDHQEVIARWNHLLQPEMLQIQDIDADELTQIAQQSEYNLSIFSANKVAFTDMIQFWISYYKHWLEDDERWTTIYLNQGVAAEISCAEFATSVQGFADLVLPAARFGVPANTTQCIEIACDGTLGFGAELAHICETDDLYWGLHTYSAA